MEPLVAGPAAEWLHGRRAELNQRFARLARRYPKLDGELALLTLAEVLPALAGDGQDPATADLLAAVFDLVLLHVARGTSGRPAVARLLATTLPALRPLLLQRPSALPAALSNAVEQVGADTTGYCQALERLSGLVATPAELLDAGAVAAWRCGRAPLRQAALQAMARLPGRAALTALDLGDWPEAAAELVRTALAQDAWTPLTWRFRDDTLQRLGREGAVPQDVVLAVIHPAQTRWRIVARLGAWQGFGGPFAQPPEVLAAAGRHELAVRVDGKVVEVTADGFGAVFRTSHGSPGTGQAPYPAGWWPQQPPAGTGLDVHGAVLDSSGPTLLPELAGAASFSLKDGCLAVALPDSHRLRIAVRVPEAV